jgi:hypothetical protein
LSRSSDGFRRPVLRVALRRSCHLLVITSACFIRVILMFVLIFFHTQGRTYYNNLMTFMIFLPGMFVLGEHNTVADLDENLAGE